MTGSKLIDSTIWIDYLIKGTFANLIGGDELLNISSLSLFEIKKKLLKNKKLKKEQIEENLSYIKTKCQIINLDEIIAEKAEQNGLGLADAIIYATSLLNNLELITLDNDFQELNNVKVFEK